MFGLRVASKYLNVFYIKIDKGNRKRRFLKYVNLKIEYTHAICQVERLYCKLSDLRS